MMGELRDVDVEFQHPAADRIHNSNGIETDLWLVFQIMLTPDLEALHKSNHGLSSGQLSKTLPVYLAVS